MTNGIFSSSNPSGGMTTEVWVDGEMVSSEPLLPLPQNEHEAALMALIGTNWLTEHAPHRLKKPPACIEWDEPFDLRFPGIATTMRMTIENVAKVQRLMYPEYDDDEQAVIDFMAVHSARRV